MTEVYYKLIDIYRAEGWIGRVPIEIDLNMSNFTRDKVAREAVIEWCEQHNYSYQEVYWEWAI